MEVSAGGSVCEEDARRSGEVSSGEGHHASLQVLGGEQAWSKHRAASAVLSEKIPTMHLQSQDSPLCESVSPKDIIPDVELAINRLTFHIISMSNLAYQSVSRR